MAREEQRVAFDPRPYQGRSVLGSAYAYMLERDAHAPGSVDQILHQRMVRLLPETVNFLYGDYSRTDMSYVRGSRPSLEKQADSITAHKGTQAQRLAAIAHYCARLGDHADDNLETMILGGSEEDIIARGSDWCTDVARVGCMLCQIVGIPARLANLFDLGSAYSGHVVVEAYRLGTWGAVDTSTPVTTWELMHDAAFVREIASDPTATYSRPEQFSAAAIVNYRLVDWESYDYTPSGLNEYYRSILRLSQKGWPGGLRWLHGEDGSPPVPGV
jgi:hypothetical protein